MGSVVVVSFEVEVEVEVEEVVVAILVVVFVYIVSMVVVVLDGGGAACAVDLEEGDLAPQFAMQASDVQVLESVEHWPSDVHFLHTLVCYIRSS